MVLVACASARQCGKRVWSAVAAESAAMEPRSGVFGPADDDDDFFYYHSWRNNVVIAFGTFSSFLT